MATILLTKTGRVELARSFYRDIKNSFDYTHVVIGMTSAWANETTPPMPEDSEKYINGFRKNIMLSKLVGPSDVCHLVKRIDWISGTVYSSYDDNYSSANPSVNDATTLSDSNFYVITTDLKVFKCIDNNGGMPSTVMPVSDSTSTVETSDSYRWKFMFQVSASDETRFLDSSHIPVRKLTTGGGYGDVNGEISAITVTNGGSGYDPNDPPAVLILGDGIADDIDANGDPIPNANATATVNASGVITGIIVNNGGSGYSFANISFTGTGAAIGSGATAKAVLSVDSNPTLQQDVEDAAIPGAIDRILIESNAGGSDYVDGNVSVLITGDGTGATATAVVAAGTGTITGVNITSPGSGYTFAVITFVASAPAAGAIARAVISPLHGHGFNPVRELFSTTIGINVSLSDNTNSDLFLDNDFRQIGLIKNMLTYVAGSASTVRFDGATGSALYEIDVNDSSNYSADDIVTTDDSGSFRVVHIITGETTDKVYLQPIVSSSLYPLIDSSSVLNNTTKNIPNLSINSAVIPEVDTSTGEVIYIENRAKINRTSDQVETIKALINF